MGEMPEMMATRAMVGVPAVSHLFRVAAGLESAVVGEDEVLHQVRRALHEARSAGAVDHRLARLFEMASAAGRRSRAGHPGSPLGLAEAAVAWLGERVALERGRMLVVGAGRVGSALARAAGVKGAHLTIASRDVRRAARLAALHRGDPIDLDAAASSVSSFDAVGIALAGPWLQVAGVRVDLPPVADLSAPSALPDAVMSRTGAFLGIDQLFTKGTPPPGYLEAASAIVEEWVVRYADWLSRRDAFGQLGLVAS
jgi:glutamyl-tRNA reductase